MLKITYFNRMCNKDCEVNVYTGASISCNGCLTFYSYSMGHIKNIDMKDVKKIEWVED